MTVILFDDQFRSNLLPLTFTRPVADLRVGILTIAEKWAKQLKLETSFKTEEYLQTKYPSLPGDENLLINGSVCPDEDLTDAVLKLNEGQALVSSGVLLALRLNREAYGTFNPVSVEQYETRSYSGSFCHIRFPEDIFKFNDAEIRKDFKTITAGRTSAALSSTNTLMGEDIFLEEGAQAECSSFNATQGPIYLGHNSQVWEGCHIRGSFALGADSIVKMGAKIYSMTSIGPNCKVAGEINNSVIWGNSSKGHEGYLGNSVVGEWCNFGADSNNSNMKNNYADVKLWDYSTLRFRKTGLQFCGMIMGDHSKCAINTMFNTGTVVGVSANIFGSGFPRQFIPDFAWGGNQGFEVYSLKKMFETAERVYERKNARLNEVDKNILVKVFDLTEHHRKF